MFNGCMLAQNRKELTLMKSYYIILMQWEVQSYPSNNYKKYKGEITLSAITFQKLQLLTLAILFSAITWKFAVIIIICIQSNCKFWGNC